MTDRYEFAPLEARAAALVGQRMIAGQGVPKAGVPAIAATLGIDPRQVLRWRRGGLKRSDAEKLAERLHEHPYVFWPDMRDRDIAAADSATVQCAGPFCVELFVPVHPHQRYCRQRCQARARQARRSEARRRANRGERECAAADCDRRFVPPMKTGPVPLYCSDTCGHREHQRTYRLTEAGKEANRRAKRKYDAEVREIKRRRADGGHLERRRPAA